MKLQILNTDFKLILAAKAAKDWQTVTETSLARAYTHVKNGQFGILTNHRAGNSPTENREGFYSLKSRLRALGLGAIMLWGYWRECQDPTANYKDCPDDQLKEVREPSLFVPGIDFDTLKSLGTNYQQDAVVYCGPETNNQVILFFLQSGEGEVLGDFHPNKIAQAYSRLPGKNGRTFVFEYVAQSHFEALLEQHTTCLNTTTST